jgi:hypothetical protein
MPNITVGGRPSRFCRVADPRRLQDRLVLVALVAIYYGTFIWAYRELLEPWQSFWGFGRSELGVEYWILNWMMVLLPALWMPMELRRPSQLLFMCQYLVLFVPATLVLYSTDLPRLSPDEALGYLLAMFVGLTIMQAIYLLPLVRLPWVQVQPWPFWGGFLAVTLALLVLVVIFLGANMQFIGLKAIYTVRRDAAQMLEVQGGSLVLYAMSWFAGVSLPVLFAVAVYRRSVLLVLAVLAAYGFLFGVTGTKTAMLAIVILGAAALVSARRGARFSHLFVLGVSLLLAFPVIFDAFGEVGRELQRLYVSFVHARIFGVPQLVMAQYIGFFAQHPETAWSQVAGISAIVADPYDMDLPVTLGYFYYGTPVGLNAGLWAQDGIAAGGMPALLLMSIVAAGVLWIFDSMAVRVPPRFAFIAVAVIGVSFMNIPLPTTLVSAGMALLAVLMYLAPHIPERR